ncbi:signal peptidase I [Candidatus Entotheonella palauensis]|uniref:signal peptidase I n=1 Tax=Candidatus Entotheonella palauensis TaxID=93172 RepID=UPI002118AFE2|nr:signal peptidase I [Candidatus Entotheonella palauensis]
MGGDHVVVRQGHLLINGIPAWQPNEPEIERFGQRQAHLNFSYGGGPAFGPVTIPQGSVMVMGDFRGNSHDSRRFGLISERAIYARAVGVYWRRGRGPLWKPL